MGNICSGTVPDVDQVRRERRTDPFDVLIRKQEIGSPRMTRGYAIRRAHRIKRRICFIQVKIDHQAFSGISGKRINGRILISPDFHRFLQRHPVLRIKGLDAGQQ